MTSNENDDAGKLTTVAVEAWLHSIIASGFNFEKPSTATQVARLELAEPFHLEIPRFNRTPLKRDITAIAFYHDGLTAPVAYLEAENMQYGVFYLVDACGWFWTLQSSQRFDECSKLAKAIDVAWGVACLERIIALEKYKPKPKKNAGFRRLI